MIRGINRLTVEINSTGSPYFERAICFVKPKYAKENRLDLHRAALSVVSQLDGEVERIHEQDERDGDGRKAYDLRTVMPLLIAALSGAAAAFIVCLIA